MAAERNEKPTTSATDHELLLRFARRSDESAFEEILRRHGALVLDRRALEDIGMDETMELSIDLIPTGISIRSALRLAFDQDDLEFVLTNKVLLVTTPEEAEGRLDTRVYSTDQLSIATKELIEVITGTILPQSWDTLGGPGVIHVLPEDNKGLVISQTQRVHERIADLLEQIRRNADSTNNPNSSSR